MNMNLFDEIDFTIDRDAIIYQNEHISYPSLHELINTMKGVLVNTGLSTGDVIAVYMNRTPMMLATILAILQCDMTYVPIDTTLPDKRIKYMVRNCDARAVITDIVDHRFRDGFTTHKFNDISILLSHTYSSSGSKNKSSISYIVYTSGSTGTPKGVMITEGALRNFISAFNDEIPFRSCDKMLCMTSISFDIFFLEAIVSLFYGLTIVLLDSKQYTNVRAISKAIEQHGIDILQITPSRLQQLIYYDSDLKALKSVKHLLVGGESIKESVLSICKAKLSAQIYNLYGPSETTIWSSIKNLTNDNRITIGRPIRNTVFKIDRDSTDEKNFEGELFISGAGLMAGYINNNKLTKNALIELEDNLTYYRTGDIVARDEYGEYVFLGRLDNQVKLNGFRIELEEVERVLMQEGFFSNCIVKKEGAQLVCYYIGQQEADEEQVKHRVASYLPHYMIPSRFNRLYKFPLTNSGKVDRSKIGE